MSTYQHSLLYSLAEMANGIRGILPSSLRWKEVSKDKFFIESDAYFTSKSIYLGEKPLVKIKDYVDWDSQQFHGNKKPVNYLDESRAEYWQRTYVTGMLESLGGRQGVYTHFLPVPSNRPNATAIQVEAKSVQWIKENILPVILAHEQGRPALDVKDYNQKRLNLPSLDSNGKVVPNAADATLDDIIRAFDAEVVRVKQALRDADLKVEALELLESNLVSIASKGLIQYESKMPKDLKEEIPKRAEAEYYAAMEEKGVPKAKAEALLEESGADLYEEIYNKITTEYNNYETGSKSEKNAKLAELRDSILDAGVELFVYNYIINQHQATQLLYADPAFFPTGAILTKRIQLPTSSGTVPLINPKSGGLDTKSTVLVLKEVKVHLELKEVYEKMVKLPANSPIRKQLESLDPKDPLKWADSQGFTHPDYYKQLNVSFSPEAGLDVVQKFMYYSVDEKGIPRTLKFSSITLTDELCASFPYFKTIRDSMDEYNKDTTRPPIGFATFQSSVKLAAPSGASVADEFSGNFVIDENSTFQIHNQFLRMPLNPASEPLGSTMAPGQGNYLINANQLNSEETAILYDHIDTIIDMADKLASKDFQLSDKGKPTRKTLSIIRKLVIKAVSGLDAGQLEESLLEAQNKSGYSVSSSLPLIKNRVVKSLLVRASKTVTRYRLRGSKLVLMSEFGSFVKNIPGLKQRQDNLLYKDENGFTEVIMPDTFRGLYTEGQLLGFRIPSTHLHSFVAIKVVGFYPVPEGAQGNVVITPSMIQFTSGAD